MAFTLVSSVDYVFSLLWLTEITKASTLPPRGGVLIKGYIFLGTQKSWTIRLWERLGAISHLQTYVSRNLFSVPWDADNSLLFFLFFFSILSFSSLSLYIYIDIDIYTHTYTHTLFITERLSPYSTGFTKTFELFTLWKNPNELFGQPNIFTQNVGLALSPNDNDSHPQQFFSSCSQC